MILELAFFVFLLKSSVKSFPQGSGYINSQYGDPNSPSLGDVEVAGNVPANAEVQGCDSLNGAKAIDASQYSKKSLTKVDNFNLAETPEIDYDQIMTPPTTNLDNNEYAGKSILLSYTDETPDCEDGTNGFCCSFKELDPWGQEDIHEFYDCLSPEELRRTGKMCNDEGLPKPNSLPWNKRWDCCRDRIQESHQIGDKIIKTWIGKGCKKYEPAATGRQNGDKKTQQNTIHQNFCPQTPQPRKALKLQSQNTDSSLPVAGSTDEENNLE